MGYRTYDDTDYTTLRTASAAFTAAPSVKHIYTSHNLHTDLDPKKIQIRESRNSPVNPKSTPIILALDVTGSMGESARRIATDGMLTLITEIFKRKPVSDPHIMFMGIGDATMHDQAPLQASQFEADIKMLDEMKKLWLEFGGGGNRFESYNLPWHFAAFHTSCDAFEKDNRKGFLFTFGDEGAPHDLTEKDLRYVYGDTQETCATNRQLLDILSSRYHVFHLRIKTPTYTLSQDQEWRDLLGQNSIVLDSENSLGEIIISTMQLINGDSLDKVAASWGGSTAVTVTKALSGMALTTKSASAVVDTGITRI
jgi:hypothetical protein